MPESITTCSESDDVGGGVSRMWVEASVWRGTGGGISSSNSDLWEKKMNKENNVYT